MNATSLNVDNQYLNAFKANQSSTTQRVAENKEQELDLNESKIHNSAVNVSISMQSIKVFLDIKSAELTQRNTSAQTSLLNMINNIEIYDFLSGKELDGGFSLKSIGYEGKAITKLSVDEAKDLVSDNGFFGVKETSSRVSSFVINMAGDNVEALQEARKGIIKGFEQAEKIWGGELPQISYETQKETLKIVDEKIAELFKTDFEKKLENTDIKK